MLYRKNMIIQVEVTAIKPYGAFVKIDDSYNGLIHISEINGYYIKDINNFLKIGDIRKARILDIDEENKHIKLSLILNKNSEDNIKLSGTNLGFDLFDEILPEWIKNKIDEINQKNN